jgi:hypothetical protein
MADRRHILPDHDLTLHLVSGEHTSAETLCFFQALDDRCATRWLSYFDPTVDMSKTDIASMPVIREIIAKRRKELFRDGTKPYAMVCVSESSARYFQDFWRKYVAEPDLRVFRSLGEAFNWLELPEPARCAAATAIHDWEVSHGGLRGGL